MNLPRIIYAIKHNRTGKIYVGSSQDYTGRILNHMYRLRNGNHSNKSMQNDFNNYGENYSFYKLDVINEYEERKKEYLWMEILHSREKDTGYNLYENARKFSLESYNITDSIHI